MKLSQFLACMEQLAPRQLAEEWDNPGLLIEPEADTLTRILVALDATPEVAKEAARVGAQLVLTHHPLFFKPVRHIHHSDPQTAAAYALVRNGIGLFAAHTNLDSALNGVNDALAAALQLQQVRALGDPQAPLGPETAGLGRVGMLQHACTLHAFALFVQDRLGSSVRFAGAPDRPVHRVAVLGGSGGDFLEQARAAGADVLVTGDAKHDQALAANVLGIGLVAAGHYETERVVLRPLIAGLQDALGAIQCKVDLLEAASGCAPLVAP